MIVAPITEICLGPFFTFGLSIYGNNDQVSQTAEASKQTVLARLSI